MTALIVTIGVIILVFRFRSTLETAARATGKATAPLRSSILPFPGKYKETLVKYFPYYNKLSHRNQHAFEQKLMYFILSKKFIPRQFGKVTHEMKAMIGACAVQLTFGLPRVYLQHFDKILIYPDEYYSAITKRFHKGEVNPAFGAIVLSWKSFVDGYIHHTDSVNLGLHEMAHALRLENIIHNDEYEFFDDALVARFDAIAQTMCNGNTTPAFLRAYACTNPHEFFAVAVENFFERPKEFKAELPELFHIMVNLLKQDPAGT
jgi:MtfA peptidase